MFIDTLHHGHHFLSEEIEMDSYLADNSICANAVCSCPVVESGTFCSDDCRGSSGETASVVCDCGHSSCTAQEVLVESRAAGLLN